MYVCEHDLVEYSLHLKVQITRHTTGYFFFFLQQAILTWPLADTSSKRSNELIHFRKCNLKNKEKIK